MKSRLLCLACFGSRLASLYDSATDFYLYQLNENLKIYPAGKLSLPLRDPLGRASILKSCGVNYLLCGAICKESKSALFQAGIQVLPWLKGNVPDVLSALGSGNLSTLAMPGCQEEVLTNSEAVPGNFP